MRIFGFYSGNGTNKSAAQTAGHADAGSLARASRSTAALLISALAMGMAVGGTARAQEPVTVNIGIVVGPIADISFPEGNAFQINVPEEASAHGAPIEPVRIPFTVYGNASATVFARPDMFVKVAEGSYRGQATLAQGSGEELGYDVVVQFPVPTQNYSGLPHQRSHGGRHRPQGVASLPYTRGAATPSVTTNVGSRNSVAHGTIHIVARHDWTRDGRNAAPGDYTGAVEVTVLAN